MGKVMKADAIKLRSDFSDKLSTQCRTIGIGILVGTWGALTAEKRNPDIAKLKWHLLVASVGAVLVLFLDFLQYVAGITSVEKTLDKMRTDRTQEGNFDEGSWAYIASSWAFRLKSGLLIVVVLYLLIAVGIWLVLYG